MPTVEFSIPMKPFQKERPRFGKGFTYTPQKTRENEKALRLFASRCYQGKPLEGGLSVRLRFLVVSPAKPSHPYPSRMDLDNYAKAVLDGLNGILWPDDRHIFQLQLEKCWSPEDRIEIWVTDGKP